MNYYLSELGDRLVIDEVPYGKVEQKCEAPCWLAAKAALGFDLSPLQEILAERQAGDWMRELRRKAQAA